MPEIMVVSPAGERKRVNVPIGYNASQEAVLITDVTGWHSYTTETGSSVKSEERKEFWKAVCIAVAGSSNCVKPESGPKFADAALEAFDKKFPE